MKKLLFIFLILASPIFARTPQIPNLFVIPEKIVQGEPILLEFSGLQSLIEIESAEFLGKSFRFFNFDERTIALVGVDIHQKAGVYTINIKLKNGMTYEKRVTVLDREKIPEPLGIPEKLGGNTTTSQNNLVSDLAKENATLENIRTARIPVWWENFSLPLGKVFITSPFGYSRETGNYTIAHKGTDFRASEGTSVQAINLGIVRVVQNGRTYGKTLVIDHGAGVQSFYLHLSEINVKVGEIVYRGQVVALSGETGYATGPHLHLSIRINGSSVDPMKFFELFK